MGIGKPISSVYRLIPIVFFNNREKLKLPKNLSKYLSPTQGLPKIPSFTLKSLNANITPLMGAYAKTIKYRRTGRIIRYRIQFFLKSSMSLSRKGLTSSGRRFFSFPFVPETGNLFTSVHPLPCVPAFQAKRKPR